LCALNIKCNGGFNMSWRGSLEQPLLKQRDGSSNLTGMSSWISQLFITLFLSRPAGSIIGHKPALLIHSCNCGEVLIKQILVGVQRSSRVKVKYFSLLTTKIRHWQIYNNLHPSLKKKINEKKNRVRKKTSNLKKKTCSLLRWRDRPSVMLIWLRYQSLGLRLGLNEL